MKENDIADGDASDKQNDDRNQKVGDNGDGSGSSSGNISCNNNELKKDEKNLADSAGAGNQPSPSLMGKATSNRTKEETEEANVVRKTILCLTSSDRKMVGAKYHVTWFI